MRHTKIVCTLGPASSSVEALRALVEAGMDCARLNFSHGEHEQHLVVAERLRQVAETAHRPVALLADSQGPKVRVGKFASGAVDLKPGARFVLSGDDETCDEERAWVSYARLADEVSVGDSVLLDDGLLRLRVEELHRADVICRVEVGGRLSSNKGVNVPGADLSIPALTEKDRRDLDFAVRTIGVDYVALSFVRSATDVVDAQQLSNGVPVIAKLEKPQAIEVLDEILVTADGVMVARGDLGVELGPEKVPMVQKRIIHEANSAGKLVITATQMLESMMRAPRPTRAEAADVANAILDGTDAIMLSGETAVGSYPIEAARMMDSIAREVELSTLAERTSNFVSPAREGWEFATAAARVAALLTQTMNLAALVVTTRDGRTAELLSQFRPRAPIYAMTPDQAVSQRLALRWGVSPRTREHAFELEHAPSLASRLLRSEGVPAGAPFALVTGWPSHERTNTVKLHRVEEG